MAKKNTKNSERRAIVEQMRKEQQRKERRRSMLILGLCVVVVVALLSAALVPYIKDVRKKSVSLAKMGASTSAAACSPQKKKEATGAGQHITPPARIDYPDAPPAFGKHWGNFLQGSEIRSFYSRDDRPELERLVHSLEHGHTILWYDDTVKKGSKAYSDIQAIASKADSYFMAAPWEKKDGGSLPAGKHVVLTHWTGPDKQQGVWEYCAKPSGAVVEKFTAEYKPENAPEPGGA